MHTAQHLLDFPLGNMEMSVLPPGFRFNPTDEELVVHYLTKKVLGRKTEAEIIGDIDIYKFEPSDLPGLSILPSKDREWYFFNLQDKKHMHGSRLSRTTNAGYWKATGKDRKVNVGNRTIGMKKTLIYYHGRAPNGQRTDWIMHEYRLDETFEKTIMGKNHYVLCRIRKKGGPGPRNGEQYGAPIFEVNEQDESDLINVKEVSDIKIFESINQNTVTTMRASADTNMPLDNTEESDSLFDILYGLGQPLPIDVIDIVADSDDINEIPDTISRSPPSHSGNYENIMESLHDVLHPAEKEPDILEEMLREITAKAELGDGHMHQDDGLDSPVDFYADETLDFGDFFELADLQNSNDESAADLSSFNLNCFGHKGDQSIAIEPRMHHTCVSTSMNDQGTAARRLRLQLQPCSVDGKQEEVSFTDRAQEVPSHQSSCTSDTNHLRISFDGEHDTSNSVTGASSRKTMVEKSVSIPNEPSEILIGTSEVQNSGLVGSSEVQDPYVVSGASIAHIPSMSPLSPKALLSRAVLGLLEDVPVLPASALELPFVGRQLQIQPVGALHKRIKSNTSFELHRSTQLLDESQRQSLKTSGSGYSVFLLRMATLALILFCLIRGFWKLTRTALTIVL